MTRPLASPIFWPTAGRIAASQLSAFMSHYADETHGSFDQRALHQFSLAEPDLFWRLLLNWTELLVEGDPEPTITTTSCEEAQFFPNLRLNYAEALLAGNDNDPAVMACHTGRPPERLTRAELREQVLRAAASLQSLGIKAGDRVVAIAHNDAATVVACLAAAAIGASFSTAPPEMGEEAALGRFAQLSPRLLFCHTIASAQTIVDRVAAVAAGLPSLVAIVVLDEGAVASRSGIPVLPLAALTAASQPQLREWPRLPFNHPLFILFSSGTTGAPKCIIHGAGGTLLEHVKEHRLHCDLRAGERLFFHTSCAWMMWNWQLSALASGVEIVLYDGAVSGPETLWRIVAAQQVTQFGTSPAYLKLCQDGGYEPARAVNLTHLCAVMSTGSILHDQQYDWFARAVGRLPLQSISGGTDIVGCFMLGSPNLPVWRGETQCVSLGIDVRALPDSDETRVGRGELICANPFPSRPLGLFGDSDGSQFHRTYFAQNPGVWTHGDFVEITPRGTARILGRSDGVMNIRGIRIGPAEIYRVLQDIPEVAQSLAVAQQDEQEPGHARMLLLVTPTPGQRITPDVSMRIRRTIGARLTAAHVPAVIAEVAELPVTHNGKLSETAATAAVNREMARNREALRNPNCLITLARHPALRFRREFAPHVFRALPPETSPEVKLTTIWQELFGIAPIELDDDYFELGGDSLLAVSLMAAIEEVTGRQFPLSVLMEVRTIRGFATLLRAEAATMEANLVLVRAGEGRPIFLLPSLAGTVMEQHELLRELSTPRPVYGLQAPGVDGTQEPDDRVESIAARYLEAVRLAQPHGPYALVGYSFGGLVAYEMARQLKAAGETVEHVALLDTAIHPRFLPPFMRLRLRLRQIGLMRQAMRGRRPQAALGYLSRELRRVVQGVRLRLGQRQEVRLGASLSLPPVLERVRAASGAAFMAYRPLPYDGAVLFVRASERSEREADPVGMWQRVAAQLDVEDVPGNHFALIEKPAVERVAAALLQRLEVRSSSCSG